MYGKKNPNNNHPWKSVEFPIVTIFRNKDQKVSKSSKKGLKNVLESSTTLGDY